MKQPVPSRGHAPGTRPDAPHRGHALPAPRVDLRVRYYYRMKPQRVYPLVVEVPRGSAASAPVRDPVVVRPRIPGAHVVPAEQALDVNRAGTQVTFYVTPLARGRLPGPCVELLQHGRPAGAIGLRMKAVTQRRTWFLLLLAVLIPALLYYYTHHPLRAVVPQPLITPDLGQQGGEMKNEGEGKEKAKPDDGDKGAALPADLGRLLARADQDDKTDEKKDDKPGERQGGEPKPPARPGRAAGQRPPAEGQPAGPVRGEGARPEAGGGPTPRTHEMALPETPGKVLEYYLVQEAKDDFPDVPVISKTIVPPVASWLGEAYGVACCMPGVYLWVALALLGLTVISWWLRGSRSTSRRARVDLLATPGAGQETLPLAPGESRPLGVEPA
jgi:hypothetical protein